MELFECCTAGQWRGSLTGLKVVIFGGCGFVGVRIADAFALAGAKEIVLFDTFVPKPLPLPVVEDQRTTDGDGSTSTETEGERVGCDYLRPTDWAIRWISTQPVGTREATWRHTTRTKLELSVTYRFVTGDVSNPLHVRRVLQGGTDVVVHLAGYGMSGRTMFDHKNIERVNVGGARNVVELCKEMTGVKALVYASSYNAAFYGQQLVAGGADVERPPVSKFKDTYSRTKSVAEELMVGANGFVRPNGTALATVALRLAGIYGPGEQRHFPRMIRLMKCGLVQFTFGGLSSRVDWIYVDNVAYGFARAASLLVVSGPRGVAAGRVFPLSDHNPVNQWVWLAPLMAAIGVRFPSWNVPLLPLYYIAAVMDFILELIYPVLPLDPFLTRAELLKVSVEHYYAPSASADIRYVPIVPPDEGMRRTVRYFKQWTALFAHSGAIIQMVWTLLRTLIVVSIITSAATAAILWHH